MALPPIVLVAAFTGFPIVVSVAYTFGHTGGLNASVSAIAQHQVDGNGKLVDVAPYSDVFHQSLFRQSLVATVWVTIISTAIVLVLSWAIALYARLTPSRLGRLLSSLSIVPLFIPVVIASYAVLQFFSYGGFVKTLAHALGMGSFPALGFTLGGVVVGEVWTSLPFGVLMISSGLQAVPDSLFEAARDAGASVLRATWNVLVPLNLVPSMIAFSFTAIGVIGSFTVPFLIGPTAPNLLGPEAAETFQSFNEPQQAEVIAIVLFALSVVVAVPYLWATHRRRSRAGIEAA
ncbi:MAG TPA: ABC transporter permease subunit [Acidimicrobiales bacterium]|nr:ABC transporter permease subunit [Acidimicrobiales bacterium]